MALLLVRIATSQPSILLNRAPTRSIQRFASSTITAGNPRKDEVKADETGKGNETRETSNKQPQKSMAQMDEEMRSIMEGLSGDGGASGAELEDGKPVAMKRSVRENMFRYI